MSARMLLGVLLGLALAVTTAYAQQDYPIDLSFDADYLGSGEFCVQCGCPCTMTALFPSMVVNYVILTALYQPGEPLTWSVFCGGSLDPENPCVVLGETVPDFLAGYSFIFVAVGATGSAGYAVSNPAILHVLAHSST